MICISIHPPVDTPAKRFPDETITAEGITRDDGTRGSTEMEEMGKAERPGGSPTALFLFSSLVSEHPEHIHEEGGGGAGGSESGSSGERGCRLYKCVILTSPWQHTYPTRQTISRA